ncbi:PadR family transcriptional regulator [Buchananella hordeovulneris]|uniref:PadR family transcriptional regulator n=1 Tax=Buchananella hordeovulneris TaxID=52770 RepID=UPI000F5E64E0|nr:helix-turn-helix transcriptional regulator [Buchananella hordeovulneris]RRD43135.1 PadR family transcriptional regulator [Buchananella hordeovulneris]RRD53203.1 PadR family transcriptional regulator [Buchananella hordeovulneris]
MRVSKDLVAAAATPIVLGVLARGEDYGYSILRRIKETSGGVLDWSEGMLYPLLHRLQRQGLVAARWGEGDSGRRRKYYGITTAGRTELHRQAAALNSVNQTLQGLLPPRPFEEK